MKTFISRARKFVLYIFAAVLVGGSPMAAFAEEAAPSEQDGGYVFDETTGRWNSNKWRYDPTINNYVPNTPAPAPVEDQTVTEPGPASNNDTTESGQSSAQNNTNNTNQINNDVSGTAKTGDATVNSNNTAGGATTGNATSAATILNQINSNSALSSQPYTFTLNVDNDVYGDIVLAPELLKGMSEVTGSKNNQAVNYNVVDKNAINNTVNLDATSGNAGVLNNTKAGSATSGNATAIANVLNIINSVIAANRSFVGTININGNLNGDILLNKEGSPSLIASNAESNPLTNGNLIANAHNLTNIINNIELDATTGTASVDNNTNAGSAKSGTADTNLVVMNLAGRTVVAKNSLLVFVNVLGKWVGIIVDAPTGATAAVLGDDVTSNLIAAQGDMTLNADSQNQITNNIKVGAHTGDATASGNTEAGDATTGNASASATVLNMANSAFSVSDWFGVLFINVLGSWYGSFGVDTPQGDEVAASSAPPTSEQPKAESVPAQVFSFVERHIVRDAQQQNIAAHDEVEASPPSQTAVLAASDKSSSAPVASSEASSQPFTMSLPLAIGLLAGLSVVAGLVIRLIGALRERFARVA